MATLKQRLKTLFTSRNFWRAAVIYPTSLGLGLLGFFLVGGVPGDFMLACFPGLGSGIAIALLNNGDKKPVTLKSSASTIIMLLIFTIGSYILGITLIAVFTGFGLSLVGSFIGLRFCMWENKQFVKREATKKQRAERRKTKNSPAHPVSEQHRDSDEDLSQSNKSVSPPLPEASNE